MLCNAIEYLSNKAKQDNADPSSSTFVSHLTPQQHATVVGLVGKRCIVKGEINGQKVDVLWDTGAQVSLISDQLVRRNFPGITVKNISELLNSELNLTAANGGEIPYIGWVELNFRLLSSKEELAVPFLVTDQALDTPIIGFNVIEEIVKTSSEDAMLHQEITSSFTELNGKNASALVNFIQSRNQRDLCLIKTMKHDTIIPPKQSQSVTCRANTGPVERTTPVLFEPDEPNPWPSGLEISETLLTVKKGKSSQVEIDIVNNTNHDIRLPGRTLLGRPQLVQSVTPAEVRLKDSNGNMKTPDGEYRSKSF